MTGNDQNIENETEVVEESEEPEDLSVVEKIMGVFVSPVSTFKYLSKNPDFWTPFILLALIGIAVGFLIMPVMVQGTELSMAEGMTSNPQVSNEDAEEAMAMIQKYLGIGMYIVTFIGTPIQIAIQCLLFVTIVFFLGLFQGMDADFKRLLGVLPWTLLIAVIGSIINGVMLMGAEITEAATMQDPSFLKPFSLAGFLPETVNLHKLLVSLASIVEPFAIWSLIVTVFAIEAANKCSRSRAIGITAILLALTIIFQLAISAMSMGAS